MTAPAVSHSAAQDTICARLTPPGSAALATIAILGPQALDIAATLFRSVSGTPIHQMKTDRPYYGQYGHSAEDDVVLHVQREGNSACVEIHCHGGPALVDALLNDTESAGARRVQWQEFQSHCGLTEIQREAQAALSQTVSPRCAAILLDQRLGVLDRAFDKIAQERNASLANDLLRWRSLGLHLVEPWKVAIYGRPNVGKSSLLNAISGFERAIVSAIPGTTRDVLVTTIALEGWPVQLIDGAGFRESADPIEIAGKESLARALAFVDLRILVVDLSSPYSEEDRLLEERFKPHLRVGSKCDLSSLWSSNDITKLDFVCSSQTGFGITELISGIAQRLVPEAPGKGTPVPFTARQCDWLSQFCAERSCKEENNP